MNSPLRLFIFSAMLIANSGASAEERMVDLTLNQCTIFVQDEETRFMPKIELRSTTVRPGGNFQGGKYLSSWTQEERKRITFVTVQMFNGEDGRHTISISLELKDSTQRPGAYTAKYNQFVLLLDANLDPTDFQERLSYEVYKQKTYISINVPGKSRYDGELKSVPQAVDSRDGRVFFTRTTDTGLTVSANCSLK